MCNSSCIFDYQYLHIARTHILVHTNVHTLVFLLVSLCTVTLYACKQSISLSSLALFVLLYSVPWLNFIMKRLECFMSTLKMISCSE